MTFIAAGATRGVIAYRPDGGLGRFRRPARPRGCGVVRPPHDVPTHLRGGRYRRIGRWWQRGAPNIILDQDISPDVDDVGPLGVLHALADRGEANILAIVGSMQHPEIPGAIDAINSYYGCPGTPIGAHKRGFLANPDHHGSYPNVLSAEFPNDVKNHDGVPDAVPLYREVLSRQPDESVTIVTTGFLSSIPDLLDSGPDRYSSLNGRELVARKVKELVVMGGRYPEGKEFNFSFGGANRYTKRAIEDWPTPITFSGWEIGEYIKTGSGLKDAPADSPVRRAYHVYFGGKFEERPSRDQTAVLYAVRGTRDYWDEETVGHNQVADDGSNRWQRSKDRDLSYLKQKVPPDQLARIIEDLMAAPPARRDRSRRRLDDENRRRRPEEVAESPAPDLLLQRPVKAGLRFSMNARRPST
jgi:hypothetical protein